MIGAEVPARWPSTRRERGNVVQDPVSKSFDEMVREATGHPPYQYQARLADQGPVVALDVPTGCGKTVAAVLPWLWRRRFHPDPDVRRGTPHWLVVCLPMRTLTEQVSRDVRGWLERLELADLGPHVLMGGEDLGDARWRRDPDRDAIVVGTVDMLLSRALNRGYAMSRYQWPVDFGLLNNGTHWVFDEVQLLGPALPTSRQLAAFREAEGFGTAVPTSTMWMSATVDHGALSTVDNPEVGSTLTLAEADRDGPLAARLGATKRIERVETDPGHYERSLAQVATEVHRPGTRTLVICNTVARAQAVHRALHRALPSDVERALLHSRFRPRDRRDRTRDALAVVDPSGPGQVLVATQVLEAGVDLTSATLLTEAGPWASMVQRAGRCNREGSQVDARFLWTVPPNARPYADEDVAGAVRALDELEGRIVTSGLLRRVKVSSARPFHPVLRKRDLRSLFDTAPDLAGNDVDVAPYIRSSDDLDVQVAWWDLPANGTPAPGRAVPSRDELCPVPVGTFRKVVKGQAAWRFDALGGQWVRVTVRDVRPGLVAVLRAADGRYDPGRGWDPRARGAVPVVEVPSPPGPTIDADPSFSGDPACEGTRWVTLAEHLADVGRAVAEMLGALGEADLPAGAPAAAELAGRLHDIGKAHPVFQDALAALVTDSRTGGVLEPHGTGPWAKSGINRPIRYSRRRFRHELVSALALFGEAGSVLDSVEEDDLVRYLVAAHHGRVRLSMRGLPDDTPCPCRHGDPAPSVLGVCGGDVMSDVTVEGTAGEPPLQVPRSTIAMWPTLLGRQDGEQPSWMERTVALRDRPDLGPFRLAFLEAVVRTADWRASREEELARVADEDSGALKEAAP